jgi:HlyD family secretion protein
MRKVISTIIVLIAVLLSANCNGNNNGDITAPGIVDGDIVTLKAMAAGTVTRLDLKEGLTVTKNKSLVQIDKNKIENQLQELDITTREIEVNSQKIAKKLRFLDANIKYLRKQVNRFQRLNKKKSISGEKLESMELRLLEAETSKFELKKSLEALDIQKEKVTNKQEYLRLVLQDHEIVAPVNGIVIEKFVSEGESVFPGTAIADILDTSSMFVEVYVEEQEMGRLKLDQSVDIRVDGLESSTGKLTGKVSYFGNKAEFSPKYIISEKERKSLLYQVKISVNDNGGVLKIGMPVTVVLRTAAEGNGNAK